MRVMLADDSALFRAGVASILTAAGFRVQAATASADELLAYLASDPPDVAVLDIRMPPTHTTEGWRRPPPSVPVTPKSASSSSRRTSKPTTRSASSRRPRGASATCSRTASQT